MATMKTPFVDRFLEVSLMAGLAIAIGLTIGALLCGVILAIIGDETPNGDVRLGPAHGAIERVLTPAERSAFEMSQA